MEITKVAELKVQCLEIAKGYSQDVDELLKNADKLWQFIQTWIN